jgi:hypothetical protein
MHSPNAATSNHAVSDTGREATVNEALAFLRRLSRGVVRELAKPPYDLRLASRVELDSGWVRAEFVLSFGTNLPALRVPVFAQRSAEGCFRVRVAERGETVVLSPDSPREVALALAQEADPWIGQAFFHPE